MLDLLKLKNESACKATKTEAKQAGYGYYGKKIEYLRKHGFFIPDQTKKNYSRKLQSEEIASSLANLRQLTLEVTDSCNLQCAYCGYSKLYSNHDHREDIALDFSLVQSTLKYLQSFWNSPRNLSYRRRIYISFYGGEPLLSFPLIQQVVNYLQGLKTDRVRFVYSMTTNGTLLKKHIRFLVENDFHLLISLDGDKNSNSYRKWKNGKPIFDFLTETIDRVKKQYPKYFAERVNFNAVLHDRNSVSEIYRFFKHEFGKTPSIGELNTTGIAEDQRENFRRMFSNARQSLFQSEDQAEIEKDMFIKLPSVQSLGIFLQNTCRLGFRDYNEAMGEVSDLPGFPTGTCIPFQKKMFITARGKILPCERIGHEHAFGVVSANKVELDLNAAADKMNMLYERIKPLCRQCFRPSCPQCLFNLDLQAQELKCNGFITERQFNEHIADNLQYLENNPGFYHDILSKVVVE